MSRKPSFIFKHQIAAEQCLRHLIRFFLEVMKENLQGIFEDEDIEFLHDFRVACRRTRSLIRQLKSVLPKQERKALQEGFAWLSRLTSRSRDLDVQLDSWPELIAELSTEAQAQLQDAHHLLAQKREQAHQDLVVLLQQSRLEQFFHLLNQSADQKPSNFLPIGKVVNQKIRKLHQRIVEASLQCDEDIHELRKEAKKLRYMMEVFSSLYDKSAIEMRIKNFKRIQNVLGDFNDMCVRIELFHQLQSELHIQASEPQHSLQQLIDNCLQKKEKEKERILASMQNFRSIEQQKLFCSIFITS